VKNWLNSAEQWYSQPKYPTDDCCDTSYDNLLSCSVSANDHNCYILFLYCMYTIKKCFYIVKSPYTVLGSTRPNQFANICVLCACVCVFGYFLSSYQAVSWSVCVCVLLLLLFKETRRRRWAKKGNIMHNLHIYIYIYNIHHIYKSFHFGNPKSDVKPEWFMFTGIYCGWTLLDSTFRSQMSSAERDFFNFPPVHRPPCTSLLSIAAIRKPYMGNRSSPPPPPPPPPPHCSRYSHKRRFVSFGHCANISDGYLCSTKTKKKKHLKKKLQHNIWYT